MKKQSFAVVLAMALFALCASRTASAADTKSQLIQIQTQLQLMQDNMSRMQQSFDERMGVMKDLLTQQTDNVNKMGSAVQNLQKTLGQQTTDAGSKVDQISGQVQALHDAVDELKARLAKVSKQLDDMQTAQQNISAPSGGQPGGNPGGTASNMPQAPPADQLYNDGLRDYNANKNDLACKSSRSICRCTAIPISQETRSFIWERLLIARETSPAPCSLTTRSWISIREETRPQQPSSRKLTRCWNSASAMPAYRNCAA